MNDITNKVKDSWKKLWHLFLWQGIIAIAFGILAFARPGITLQALVVLFGAFAIVEGIVTIVQYARGKILLGGFAMLYAIVSILAGIGLLLYPGFSVLMVVAFVSAWAVAGGIYKIATAIELRKQIADEGPMIASGILSLLFGVLLFAIMIYNPLLGAVTLGQIIGLYAMLDGVMLIVSAVNMKDLGQEAEKLSAA